MSQYFSELPMQQSSVTSSVLAMTYNIYLDRVLDEPANWRTELDTLRNASPEDVINIYFNSEGGFDSTMLAFLKAMNESQAACIVGHLEGQCCSAATVIFLNCDQFVIGNAISFMIHTGAGGYSGKINNVSEYSDHSRLVNAEIMHTAYQGFLTKEEIEAAIKGTDFWMGAQEVEVRLNKRIAWIKAQELQQETPEQAPQSYSEELLSVEDNNKLHFIYNKQQQAIFGENWTLDCIERAQGSYELSIDDSLRLDCDVDWTENAGKAISAGIRRGTWEEVASALAVEYNKKTSTKTIAGKCQRKVFDVLVEVFSSQSDVIVDLPKK